MRVLTIAVLTSSGGGYLCDQCTETLTGEVPVCSDGCTQRLSHDGTCDPRDRDDPSCQLCGQIDRLRWVGADEFDPPPCRDDGRVLVHLTTTCACTRQSGEFLWLPGPAPAQDIDVWLAACVADRSAAADESTDQDPADRHWCRWPGQALHEATVLVAAAAAPDRRGATATCDTRVMRDTDTDIDLLGATEQDLAAALPGSVASRITALGHTLDRRPQHHGWCHRWECITCGAPVVAPILDSPHGEAWGAALSGPCPATRDGLTAPPGDPWNASVEPGCHHDQAAQALIVVEQCECGVLHYGGVEYRPVRRDARPPDPAGSTL